MEALYFFRFWRQNPSHKGEDLQSSTQNNGRGTMSSKNRKPGGGDQHEEEEEEEGSFFELELITSTSLNDDKKNPIASSTDPKHSTTTSSNNITKASPLESYSYRLELDSNDHSLTISKPSKPKKAGYFLEPSSDSISKRKVLPIEPGLKPQSRISLLKSAPSLKVLTFKKSKSTARHDLSDISSCSPVLGRDNSLRRYIREDPLTTSNVDEEWKLGKYLKHIYRPLSATKEKKTTTRGFTSGSPSPSCSPVAADSPPCKEKTARGRIRVACKKLGKSKSSTVALAAPAPARRDDSLALHHDGIHGAILHCKKSFNSSRDPSFLSRFACETLQDYGEAPSEAKLI